MRALGWVLVGLFSVATAASAQIPTPQPAKTTSVAAPSTHNAKILSREDVEAWLDGYLPAQLKSADIAGALVVVVKDGHVLMEKGYGYADAAAYRPVDPQTTLFRLGSISKLFTWTAVMQLVQRHRIDLDRDVNSYLDFRIPPFHGQPITMRELMTHTGGFRDNLKDMLNDAAQAPALGDYLKSHIPDRIFAPGKVPAYSNYGAALAGYIVQRVSGQPFAEYVEQHIFAPLGMQHSTFAQPLPASLKPFMSKGYLFASDGPRPFEMFGPAPAGGVTASGADIAKFMIAHLQEGEYLGQRILDVATAREMHGSPYTTVNPALDRLSLGFFYGIHNGHLVIGHDGDTRIFHSMLDLLPNDGVGIFVALNSAGRNSDSFAIREALFDGFLNRYFPGPSPTGQMPLALSKAHAALMAGAYNNARGEQGNFASFVNLFTQTSLSADDEGHLVTQIDDLNGQPKKFAEIAPFLWREIGGKDLLGAKVVGGKVVMWVEGGDAAEAEVPVPWWRDGTWLMPLLLISIIILVITALAWPIGALIRHHYGVAGSLNGRTLGAYRWSRAGAAASSITMLCWFALFGAILSTFYITWAPYFISSAMNPWILILHAFSWIAFPFAAITAIWNLWATFRTAAGWRGAVKFAWAAALSLSCLIVLWVGVAFHLIGFDTAF